MSVWTPLLHDMEHLFRSRSHLGGIREIVRAADNQSLIEIIGNASKIFSDIWRLNVDWPFNLKESDYGTEA
jgi:hypothetical protein